MDVPKILADMRRDRKQIEAAIMSLLEHLGLQRRAGPPQRGPDEADDGSAGVRVLRQPRGPRRHSKNPRKAGAALRVE
jgi:hypothetical protein